MEQEAQAGGTSSLQHTSLLKSMSKTNLEDTHIDRELGWRSREVKHTKKENALATVPGVVGVDDADRTCVRRGKILAKMEQEALAGGVAEDNAEVLAVRLSPEVIHEEGEGTSTSQQPPDHYKDLIHDVRVRCADGMAKRIQHAQYRADAARLRNKDSLENEEKVAEDDDSFAAPGTVEFVRNGSEVSHGCITFSTYDHKERALILSFINCRVAM